MAVQDILSANIFREEVSQSLLDSAVEDWYTKTRASEIDDMNYVNSETNNDISNIWTATLAGS